MRKTAEDVRYRMNVLSDRYETDRLDLIVNVKPMDRETFGNTDMQSYINISEDLATYPWFLLDETIWHEMCHCYSQRENDKDALFLSFLKRMHTYYIRYRIASAMRGMNI